MSADPEPPPASSDPDSKLPWMKMLQGLTLLLSTVATVWSAFDNIFIANNKAAIDRIAELLQVAQPFAQGVNDSLPYITKKSDSEATAIVELVRLYALASTPAEKLSVVEIAVTSGHPAAVGNLTSLFVSEDFYIHPNSDSDRSTKDSFNTLEAQAENWLQNVPPASPSPSPAKSTSNQAVRLVPAPSPTPYGDAPLTQSADAKVAANAAFLASIPNNETGWVFVGDAFRDPSVEKSEHLFASTSVTSAKHPIFKSGDELIACQDLNLRTAPFSNGYLGQLRGIVARNTVMNAATPQDGQTPYHAFPGVGSKTGRPITAYLVYVEVTPSVDSHGC